jgi:hypothetical protein
MQVIKWQIASTFLAAFDWVLTEIKKVENEQDAS